MTWSSNFISTDPLSGPSKLKDLSSLLLLVVLVVEFVEHYWIGQNIDKIFHQEVEHSEYFIQGKNFYFSAL